MNFKCHMLALFLALGLFTTNQALAQDAPPRREVGLQFNSINFNGSNAFSAFYKKETKENVYRRFRVFYGNLGLDFKTFGNYTAFNGAGGIAIGREKRKALDSKLAFYQGPEISASFGVAHVDLNVVNAANVTRYDVNARLGWVLGLQHSFNDRWAINLETIPGFGVGVTGSNGSNPEVRTSVGFNSNVSIGIVRKF